MKLLYIANNRMPTEKAHGIQIMEMCQAFASHGEVELVIPRRLNKIRQSPFEYYGIAKVFKITRLPCPDLTPFNIGSLGFYIQAIAFLLAAKFYLLFKKYDILYTREKMVGFFFDNFVLEIHALPPKVRRFNKEIWRKARALAVKTDFIKQNLISLGINADKIIVVPNGVDLKKFDLNISKEEARRKLNLPLDKKIILYSGSLFLHDWKGISTLLDSVKYFTPNTLLLLIGGTKEEIAGLRAGYDCHNLILEEKKSHDKIPLYLKAADIFVLPNKSNHPESQFYTSPIKLFEYMAAKRPIVASDLPSIRGILDDNNAIFAEAGNPESLASSIKKLLEDPMLARRISEQAFSDVQNYTWEKMAERILKFIE
jgi:glycosyltransferase involved in cell wall biosynthesis